VPDLTDVLALMSQASDSFRSLRATIGHRRDEETYLEAWDRHWEARSAAGGGTLAIGAAAGSDDRAPATSEATVRLWLEHPHRFREEYEGAWGDHTTVSDGRTLWRRTPGIGMFREDVASGQGMLFATKLVDPAPLLPGLELELLGQAEHADRPALRVRAVPRRVTWHDLFGLAPGADEYELLVDAGRGTLLRAEACLEGSGFATSEVQEIAFDEELAPDLFVLEPGPGESVRTPEETTRDLPEDVTLDEAARRASFTVWAPRRMGRGWEIDVSYVRGEGDPLDRETVMIHCLHETHGQFSVTETAREEMHGAGWEPLERNGRRLRVWQRPGGRRMPIVVSFDEADTSVEVQSDDLDLERLLDLASSFGPVSGVPPSFFRR
jgi:outer membrane lipoprotein-sorting protein